jgi:hypothetical protein
MEILVKRRWVLAAALLGLGIIPVRASITYTCAANIDSTQAGTCSALNGSTVSGVYSSTFSNVSANIYIQYGPTGIGSSSVDVTAVTYGQYYTALAASTDDPTALASLTPGVDPLIPYGNTDGDIDITAALANALGLSVNGAETAGLEADGVTPCTLGNPGCYNGVITIENGSGWAYPLSPSDPTTASLVDFFYVVEHETDEIIGTTSCMATNAGAVADACGSTDASPADLFRYASAGTRSFLGTANGSTAYFSTDSGGTPIAYYINMPDGEDYGDWAVVGPYKVQDSEASPGISLDISNDGGSEIAVLDAIGFNLAGSAVPEPGSMALAGISLAVLALARSLRRRRQGCDRFLWSRLGIGSSEPRA